jgi:hypothetical protein
VGPGQTAEARLQPLHPEHWKDVRAGRKIAVCEGARQVGTATIESVTYI